MLIGPGGKNIRAIQEDTETVIEVAEDGRVTIAGTNGELAQVALKKVEACTATVQVGKIYDGTVSSVKDFGAFVEILPGAMACATSANFPVASSTTWKTFAMSVTK